jgi:hypothetical protein
MSIILDFDMSYFKDRERFPKFKGKLLETQFRLYSEDSLNPAALTAYVGVQPDGSEAMNAIMSWYTRAVNALGHDSLLRYRPNTEIHCSAIDTQKRASHTKDPHIIWFHLYRRYGWGPTMYDEPMLLEVRFTHIDYATRWYENKKKEKEAQEKANKPWLK